MADAARPDVRLERKGGVLWIWIDREERRNAINPGVIAGIHAAVQTAAGWPDWFDHSGPSHADQQPHRPFP